MTANNLRLMHIAKYYPPDPGGMESFVRELALAGQAGPGTTSDAPNLTVKRFKVWTVIGKHAPAAPGLFLS